MIKRWRALSNRAKRGRVLSRESVHCGKRQKRRGEGKHRPWPLSQRPGFLIRRLHQIHVALFQDACGAFEITPLQYSLLSALAVRETADQTTLAADIALDRTTTTGALKRLAARKLVERASIKDDRRARALQIDARPAPRCSARSRAPRGGRIARRSAISAKTEQALFIAMMQRIVADNANHDSTAALFD